MDQITTDKGTDTPPMATIDDLIRDTLELASAGGDGYPDVTPPDYGRLSGKARRKAFDEWRRAFQEYSRLGYEYCDEVSRKHPHWIGSAYFAHLLRNHLDYIEIAGWCAFTERPKRKRRPRHRAGSGTEDAGSST